MKNMDDILKTALTPKDEPNYWLNQSILSQAKEAKPMKKRNPKKFATVACSLALALGIGSISVYAAWKYLTPDRIAEEIGENRLAEAFSGEDSVYINETQSCGGYDITLLGITTGENLTTYKYMTDDFSVMSASEENTEALDQANNSGMKEHNDRTYVMFAVEHEGLSQEDFYSDPGFTAFPIVAGYDPQACMSILQHGSGEQRIVKDGSFYLMYECDNLEIFADNNIYMCISDDLPEFSEYSYLYDADAGTIARNEEYEGLNALFYLPLDASKADPATAQAALDAYEARLETIESTPEPSHPESVQKAFDFADQITPENIDELATPLEGENATMTFTPDNQGRYRIEITDPFGQTTSARMTREGLFPDGTTEQIHSYGISNNNPDTLLLGYYTLNADGTVTLQLYSPNLPE